ncbi:Clavaminate synthase-like protein [Ascodesmis nigricans]|uniref:Clavaminate synthase-like protein n=1 Tax=Ascodesmis nigricans TaxID=341454 RepID=A0A4S2MNS8_9PEZI|nr:Clavaminate synthase-like protein [Ascodesmis nigricans]
MAAPSERASASVFTAGRVIHRELGELRLQHLLTCACAPPSTSNHPTTPQPPMRPLPLPPLRLTRTRTTLRPLTTLPPLRRPPSLTSPLPAITTSPPISPLFLPSYHFPASTLPFLSLFPTPTTLSTPLLLSHLDNPSTLITIELLTPRFERREIPFNLYLHLLVLQSSSASSSSPTPSSSTSVSDSGSSAPASSAPASSAPASSASFPPTYAPQLPLPTLFPTLAPLLHPVSALFPQLEGTALWLAPERVRTSTPLHTDPNANVLVQVAGRKRVRMWSPEVGERLLRRVERHGALGGGQGEGGMKRWSRLGLREHEMGEGGRGVERVVWEDGDGDGDRKGDMAEEMEDWEEGYEVEMGQGEGVVIPRGWWHAVRSVPMGEELKKELKEGEARVGVSVNWWFR